MTDAEALQILQDFAHAKPLRLQRAVLHIESRMLTLADIARLAQEKVDAPDDRNKTVLAHVLESTAAYWRARSAQRSAPIDDATAASSAASQRRGFIPCARCLRLAQRAALEDGLCLWCAHVVSQRKEIIGSRVTADATSDATPDASPEAKSNDGAG